ncbi:unnamed protein product [Rangifer tarandus platyrhynchus]|uniref:Uncharacterized protein n=1 Tax=Rangifer tarandus platyrhynchus TaxID=3082113 RepID=A0AC60A2U7_RANTA
MWLMNNADAPFTLKRVGAQSGRVRILCLNFFLSCFQNNFCFINIRWNVSVRKEGYSATVQMWLNFEDLMLSGKGQFLFQSQRRAMPKNAQTTVQLGSSHMLAR